MPDFKLSSAPGWSSENALACALASQLAYEDGDAIKAQAKAWGFTTVDFIDRNETQCFVARNDDTLLIAFRGTEPGKLKDWMTDAEAALVKPWTKHGLVHAGFQRALDDVFQDIVKSINASGFGKWSPRVFITGHSLGAALATLYASRIHVANMWVYTYGSPRVGNADFAAAYNADHTFRYVNNVDVVTRVPSRLMGFTQVGQLHYFDAAGVMRTELSWWSRFLDDVRGDVDDFLSGKIAPFDDHLIANYVARCAANQGSR